MKRLWLILFLLLSSSLFADEKTFVREYTYKASDYDSKVTSRANALEQVKRLLLEEISVYMQSEFEMRDWEEQIGDKIESGDFAEVTCYEYNDSWNAPNHLRIGITRIEVENWIIDKAF